MNKEKKKVLFVEDSVLTIKVVNQLLKKNGYESLTVSSGEEALQVIASGFWPDLIVMDIELSGEMDGIEAARKITKSWDIPVIFLTAHTSDEVISRIKEVKSYGFVVKGTDKAVLLSSMELALKLHAEASRAGMFKRLFEISIDELYIFHPETLKFVAVNRAARENLGYTANDFKYMTPLDIKPEYDQLRFKKMLAPLIDGAQEKVNSETVHRRKDGSLYPVHITLQLFNYEGEKYCLALVRDLTERKKWETDLEAKEILISAVTSAAYDGIILLDNNGQVVFWNQAAEKIFGYTFAEISGKELHSLIVPDPEIYEIHRTAFRHFQTTGEGKAIGKTLELKARHKDGHELDVELSLSALKLGGVWHAAGIVREISQRKQLQEELEKSLIEYRDLTENAPIGVIKCDQEGRITYVNSKVIEILGSPGIEETKKFNLLYYKKLHQYSFSQKLKDCMLLNSAETHEMKYESLWGKKVWLRIHFSPRQVKGKIIGAQIIIDDITEKMKLEEETRQNAEKMRLIMEGLPHPAWLISRERRILAQNKIAGALFATKVGEYCWGAIHGGKTLGEQYYKEFVEKGIAPPGAKCWFCRCDEALDKKMTINEVIELDHSFWDTWWIPLGEDVYLHYAADVTSYKTIEKKLQEMADTDILLNIYNRRYFVQKLEDEIERAKRTGREFTLIMLDIDHFKKINDSFGHNSGDLVLKSIAELIKNRIRKVDILARWGGEEFIILLPDTGVSQAVILAEELRGKISETEIPGVGKVTASFGVAGYCPEDNADSLVNKADNMMYEAKAAGRNCVRYMDECE